jgi:hypothetical protein
MVERQIDDTVCVEELNEKLCSESPSVSLITSVVFAKNSYDSYRDIQSDNIYYRHNKDTYAMLESIQHRIAPENNAWLPHVGKVHTIFLNNFPNAQYILNANGVNVTSSVCRDGRILFDCIKIKNTMFPLVDGLFNTDSCDVLKLISPKNLVFSGEVSVTMVGPHINQSFIVSPRGTYILPLIGVTETIRIYTSGISFILRIDGIDHMISVPKDSMEVMLRFADLHSKYYGAESQYLSEDINKGTLNFSRVKDAILLFRDGQLVDTSIHQHRYVIRSLPLYNPMFSML